MYEAFTENSLILGTIDFLARTVARFKRPRRGEEASRPRIHRVILWWRRMPLRRDYYEEAAKWVELDRVGHVA
ncbi:MAG: hypothetical protein K8I02_05660, partial [Candidatus Methylomirabilis sp.]|nr:hypothetical protein [Deltaproteobacteria bacterium]